MNIVNTPNAPAAVGPYSQAVISNGFIFCSGQIALTSAGNIIEGGIKEQVKQIMQNLKAVLEAADSDLSKVVKTTIYLTDLNDYAIVNETYGEFFFDSAPARATVQVVALPKNAKIEIDAIAVI